MDIDPQKIVTHPLFAGITGALIGLRFAPGLSWIERITNVGCGAACAGFVAPAAGELFKLTSAGMLSFMSFAIGMFGMSLAAAIFDGIREVKLGEIFTGWTSRR